MSQSTSAQTASCPSAGRTTHRSDRPASGRLASGRPASTRLASGGPASARLASGAAASGPAASNRHPRAGVVHASQRLRRWSARSQGLPPNGDDPVSLTHEIVRGLPDVLVLEPDDNSLSDARVSAGDAVVLQRSAEVVDGELLAVRLGHDNTIRLRRVYRENGHVRAVPADPRLSPTVVTADYLEVVGRVVAIVRRGPGGGEAPVR